MSKPQRQAFEAFYAFCRLVDDVVDEATDPKTAGDQLQEWRREIERVYAGQPTHQVGQALLPVVQQHKIPQKYFEEIIAGCKMDLTQQQYKTFADLETYCYRVACCVGLVSLHLFGVELTQSTQEAAIALGKAVQLTNILRDISPDLEQGRIYLPQEYLKRFEISADTLKKHPADNHRLAELILFIGKQAKAFYAAAWSGFPQEASAKKKLFAATLMGKIYETLLEKITRQPLKVFDERIPVSTLEKLNITRKAITRLYSPFGRQAFS